MPICWPIDRDLAAADGFFVTNTLRGCLQKGSRRSPSPDLSSAAETTSQAALCLEALIIEQAKRVCGDEKITGVIGGFHLFENNEQLKKTVEYFEKNGIKNNYPCHCVSLVAKAEMMAKLPLTEVGVSMTIEID